MKNADGGETCMADDPSGYGKQQGSNLLTWRHHLVLPTCIVSARDNGRGYSNEPQSWSLDTQRLARVLPVANPRPESGRSTAHLPPSAARQPQSRALDTQRLARVFPVAYRVFGGKHRAQPLGRNPHSSWSFNPSAGPRRLTGATYRVTGSHSPGL